MILEYPLALVQAYAGKFAIIIINAKDTTALNDEYILKDGSLKSAMNTRIDQAYIYSSSREAISDLKKVYIAKKVDPNRYSSYTNPPEGADSLHDVRGRLFQVKRK